MILLFFANVLPTAVLSYSRLKGFAAAAHRLKHTLLTYWHETTQTNSSSWSCRPAMEVYHCGRSGLSIWAQTLYFCM